MPSERNLMIDMAATGANIARLRRDNNITINDMSSALGFITPQAIYKWQRGDTLPTIDNLVILADLFRTTIDAIIIRNTAA